MSGFHKLTEKTKAKNNKQKSKVIFDGKEWLFTPTLNVLGQQAASDASDHEAWCEFSRKIWAAFFCNKPMLCERMVAFAHRVKI